MSPYINVMTGACVYVHVHVRAYAHVTHTCICTCDTYMYMYMYLITSTCTSWVTSIFTSRPHVCDRLFAAKGVVVH